MINPKFSLTNFGQGGIMPNPKRKHSKARRDKRRGGNSKMYAANLSICPQCKEPKLPHRVCGNCGYYNGIEVIKIKVKKEKGKEKEKEAKPTKEGA